MGVSICAVTDTASCPLDWRLFLPERWDDAQADGPEATAVIRARRRRAGIPDAARHREKWRLALDMLDELAGWALALPVVVTDAGYGNTAEFRDGPTTGGWPYVVQVDGDLTSHPADAVPEVITYSGLGPLPKPRYRTKPVALREHVLVAGRAAAVEVC
jgi:SRSO17 transposase